MTRLRSARTAYMLARGFGRDHIFSYLMWVRMLITGRTRYRIY